MTPREERGILIAATCRVDRKKDGTWTVPSQSGNEKIYKVDLERRKCTCPDHAENGHVCKHVFAVEYTFRRDYLSDGTMIGTMTSTIKTPDVTVTKKATYRQNWSAYNLAQGMEKHRFQELLFDLTRGVDEMPTKATGRKPHTTKDSLFAMVLKVYGTLSSRRTNCEFQEAHEAGYLSKAIPGMKVSQFFENPAFTPILKALIAQSARPLRSVETQFAIDSSGFGSCRYERWFDAKYGAMKQRSVWVKAHIACGVKTNVVTAVHVLDKDSADANEFTPLVKETRQGFEIGEVSADKAYLSLESFETVAQCGGQAFIAFKANSTGAKGGLFEKAFHYFQFKQDEYMAHYHKRSNVESTFSAIKRKFGDSVRSKCDFAMVNEVLCKILAHNICVLIQEQCELGIEPIFWHEDKHDEPGSVRNVIPMMKA